MFKNINKVIKMIVMADFFGNSAFGSFGPVFAIFITNKIAGGSAAVVGFAAAIYWIVKSLCQLPIARFLDKTDGEQDDFWAMCLGYFLVGFVPIAYTFISQPWHLYLVQAFYGFIMAWVVPAWYAIFTRHVDKWRISFEWSLQSVISVGLATSLSAAIGGYVADRFGFDVLFWAAGIIEMVAALLLLNIRSELFGRDHRERVLPERSKHLQ